jgi:multisubunit Na+/H+ antiporter MnhG subunit
MSTPEPPALGILVLGAVAVLFAVGALVRFYTRAHAAAQPSTDAAVEIPAPELETVPEAPAPR